MATKMSTKDKAARVKQLTEKLQRGEENKKKLVEKLEKAKDALLEDADTIRPDTLTVTVFTVIHRTDGRRMEAALRIKEEPADLLAIYADHIGLPEWWMPYNPNLLVYFGQREEQDRQWYPSAFGNDREDHSMDVEHRLEITGHGKEDVAFELFLLQEQFDKVANQIMKRWADAGAPDNPALQEVLNVLLRNHNLLVEGSICEEFFASGVVEGKTGLCGTFGHGLSGWVSGFMVDHRIGPLHVDRYNPSELDF